MAHNVHAGDISRQMARSCSVPELLHKGQIIGLCVTLFLLAGCSLPGRGASTQPTPVVDLPAYQPGADLAVTAASEAPSSAEKRSLGSASAAGSAAEGSALAARTESGDQGVYNGEVLPEQRVTIIPEAQGRVVELYAEVGQAVEAGDLLLRIDSTVLEAQRAQALAGLEAVQAQVELLTQEPDQEDMAAAQAAVNAASQGYQRAVQGPTDDDLTMALAQVRQAEAAVTVAQAAYNQVRGNPSIAMMPQSMQLQQATIGLEAAQAQYRKVQAGATKDVVAGAYAQVAQAQAQLDRVQSGAQDAQIRAAQAQMRQAEAGIYLIQLQLDKTQVRAPMAGVLSEVNTSVGNLAGGAPVMTLLSREVKILIPVQETRLSQLYLGQPAQIRVDAYADQLFAGEVAIIAPTLDPATRTVQVTIRPTEDASVLAPGMFATVTLLGVE